MINWLPIPDFPSYEVSDEGHIRNTSTQLILKPRKIAKYFSVQLGAGNNRYIHRLVLHAFVGPPNGRIVRHKDNDASNNCLSNLQYGTPADNTEDRKRHDTWGTKLNERKVKIIRGLARCNFTVKRYLKSLVYAHAVYGMSLLVKLGNTLRLNRRFCSSCSLCSFYGNIR